VPGQERGLGLQQIWQAGFTHRELHVHMGDVLTWHPSFSTTNNPTIMTWPEAPA